jgi:hypothetical protein
MGWRPELAGGILSNLERIDVLEIIAEDYFEGAARVRALKTLAKQVPVVVHGVSLGMASMAAVDRKRLQKMARLVNQVQPESSTIESTAENLAVARAIVGSTPLMENIATLISPPASDRDEPEWLHETLVAAQAGMLLDLHNLYANSMNFGPDPNDFLARLPAERVHAVHISGGKWIGDGTSSGRRILDDHLHDPPDPVYDLLASLAERCPNPLTVILERDGDYPPIEHLLAQLDRARRALAAGRAARSRVCSAHFELTEMLAIHAVQQRRHR